MSSQDELNQMQKEHHEKARSGGYVYARTESIDYEGYPGITRRDWLAGLAMQGMLANPNIISHSMFMDIVNDVSGSGGVKIAAYVIADVMIAESNK